jgi:hypothetical protein
MEDEYTLFNVPLVRTDVEFLRKEGYKIATKVRKIVSDYVAYAQAKSQHPLKEVQQDQE